jgi:tripartite-type tricarboxylate transporter receptor subunit TctC
MNSHSSCITRRRVLALAVSCALAGTAAHALERPAGFPGSGRVSLIVPFAPGGTTDLVARLLAERLQRRWGSPVIVENKAGAGGNIGAEYVARARGDGQTLLVAATSFANAPALMKNLRYDVRQDFSPISLVATTPLVLMVSKQSGIGSVPELIARLRRHKGGLNYGTSGTGTSIHVSTLLFLNAVQAEAQHVIYKGSGPALLALASGEIDMLFDNFGSAMPFVAAGRVTGLAVTGLRTDGLKTTLPTLDQAGLRRFESATWIGLLGAAGTPAPLVAWLNAEVAAVLHEPAVQEQLSGLGFSARPTSADRFGAFILEEFGKVQRLVKDNKLALD